MARPRKRPEDRYVTPVRSHRIPDDIYEGARAEARLRGETVTDAIVRFLEQYGRPHRTKEP